MATRCWYMVTIVGEDQPGIVARVSQALFEGGCNLGEATMVRLGGSFTIMIMVEHSGEPGALQAMLQGPADALGLHLHLVRIEQPQGHGHLAKGGVGGLHSQNAIDISWLEQADAGSQFAAAQTTPSLLHQHRRDGAPGG